METSQRVVKEITDKDTKQIKALVNDTNRLVEILDASKQILEDVSKFAEATKSVNILTEEIIDVSKEKVFPY